MLLVIALISERFANTPTHLLNADQTVLLRHASEEIIPAGLNSPQGPEVPGSVEFASIIVSNNGTSMDVILSIEAPLVEDRVGDIKERAALIKDAFNELFPGTSFAIFAKLDVAGASTDIGKVPFTGDLSMPAAIERVRTRFQSFVRES